MTRKVTVVLEPSTLSRLRRLAHAERRDVPSQARVVIETALASDRAITSQPATSEVLSGAPGRLAQPGDPIEGAG